MPPLKSILRELRNEFREKEKAREEAQVEMRKVTRLSKQAILLIHQKRTDEAEKTIRKAKEIISKLNKITDVYPEIIYSGLFNSARQEYSEANIFLKLTEEDRFVTPQEIDVPPADYVLGLADAIGEYRRLALDALREGDARKGENCLKVMDEIYIELMALDDAYMLVPGLRRKCDVARKIIDITRGDITQEVRRNSLEKKLRSLENLIKKRAQTREPVE